MTALRITRGYPASGKSTLARTWVAEDPSRRARVNRDDLRAHLYNGTGVLPYAQEELITKVQRRQVETLLKAGVSVVVDDLNLRLRYARAWADLAYTMGVDFDVIDVPTPADVCIDRDLVRANDRGRHVGPDVITGLAAKFPITRWPEVTITDKTADLTVKTYIPDVGKPPVYIVDIDGTVAKKRMGPGERGWYEYDRVSEDHPNQPVIDMVERLRSSGAGVVFVSGRKDTCRDATRAWLANHLAAWVDGAELHMRAADDNRADDIVKVEIFNDQIRHRFQVLGCIDDRDRVVAMWRSLGLTCFQVAEGDF